MRFYVPEWDDAVDADYDFKHDEFSAISKTERERAFIWDIFDKEKLPIDGILISREQVEASKTKFDRITTHGVYNDPVLSIPNWLPTISDCGAWGYKELPFPPYSPEGMLEFYEMMDVDIGVTVDHLVLGSGKEDGRLYLDSRALGQNVSIDGLPEPIIDQVDIMTDEWPANWPEFVSDHDSSITGQSTVEPFERDDFGGDLHSVLDRLSDDPRAVYRENDKQFRYDLTLENARMMRNQYKTGDWSFRLMAAFQGWDPDTYTDAASAVLDAGYQYLGLGGLAGSPTNVVREVVTEVGAVISNYQENNSTRIDTHVFGFAKTDAFGTIGRSGVSSFDSASMLRAAWTGGKNYHLHPDKRHDAIRVRYPQPGDSLSVAMEKALRAREVLHALRAYDREEPVKSAITTWIEQTATALEELSEFLQDHRHDEYYTHTQLQHIKAAFRREFEYGRVLFASFGREFTRRLTKLLRADDPEDPLPFEKYDYLLSDARSAFGAVPHAPVPDTMEDATFEQVWPIIEDYAQSKVIGDEELLADYRKTLAVRPWDRCSCPICIEHGIEVAIFRGNDRNRRRGFHNTRRFYDAFEQDLPRILALTLPQSAFLNYESVEDYLDTEKDSFWTAVHDLPVAEVGVCDAHNVYEWWETAPDRVSMVPTDVVAQLDSKRARYDTIVVLDERNVLPSNLPSEIMTVDTPTVVRERVLDRLGYDENFSPTIQLNLSDL